MNKPNDAPNRYNESKNRDGGGMIKHPDGQWVCYRHIRDFEKALLAEAGKSDKAIKLLKLKHAKQEEADEQLIRKLVDALFESNEVMGLMHHDGCCKFDNVYFSTNQAVIVSAKKRLKKGEDDESH